MNQSQKNTTIETIKKWWFPTSIGIIISLLGYIGEKNDSSTDKIVTAQDRQAQAMEDLNKTVTTILVVLQEQGDALKNEKERNTVQDSDIADNTNKINDHEVRIKVLEAHQ